MESNISAFPDHILMDPFPLYTVPDEPPSRFGLACCDLIVLLSFLGHRTGRVEDDMGKCLLSLERTVIGTPYWGGRCCQHNQVVLPPLIRHRRFRSTKSDLRKSQRLHRQNFLSAPRVTQEAYSEQERHLSICYRDAYPPGSYH